jgi:hypothetical protein
MKKIAGESEINLYGWILLAIVFLLGIGIGVAASAQDAQSLAPVDPALSPRQTSRLTIEWAEVSDIKKLEDKAIEILRRTGAVTGERMTLQEARAYVRLGEDGQPNANGWTNIAVCLELVATDRLRGIVQAKVERVQIERVTP